MLFLLSRSVGLIICSVNLSFALSVFLSLSLCLSLSASLKLSLFSVSFSLQFLFSTEITYTFNCFNVVFFFSFCFGICVFYIQLARITVHFEVLKAPFHESQIRTINSSHKINSQLFGSLYFSPSISISLIFLSLTENPT